MSRDHAPTPGCDPHGQGQPIAPPAVPFAVPHEFTVVQNNRRAMLLAHVDIATAKGLEIGCYSQPTVVKQEGDIQYLDVQSREQLIAGLDDPALARRIPEVDLLCQGSDYTPATRGPFDYIVANHVLEHVANPIAWLQMVETLLVDDGILFLSLPDKKYTFDRYRPDTALSHILYDYLTGVDRTSMEHVLESELYYDQEFVGRPMRLEERLDLARLRAAFAIPMHPGWHCHVFQSETFQNKILKPLQYMGLVRFELRAYREAMATTGGEFSFVLRKRRVDVRLEPAEFFTKDYDEPPPPPGQPLWRRALGLPPRLLEYLAASIHRRWR